MKPLSAYAAKRDEALWLRVYRSDAHGKQGGRCAYCRSPMRKPQTTADHDRPRSGGGLTKAENIKAACEPCNNAKRSRTGKDFRKAISGPRPDGPYYGIWRAWMRLRLSKRIEQAERRILGVVGLKEANP
jgi:5-methylcytosine-specific restriction endonuclease McrA